MTEYGVEIMLQALFLLGFFVSVFVAWHIAPMAWIRPIVCGFSLWLHVFGGIASLHTLVQQEGTEMGFDSNICDV